MGSFKYQYISLFVSLLVLTCNLGFAQNKAITFFLVSDTHYGASETIAGANRSTIDMMKHLPGKSYPESLEGGKVGIPLGVVHCGDILDNADTDPEAWDIYRADYGVNGEGRLNYPLYESFGNHDGGLEGPVRQGIIERNKQRPGILNISENGLHYSWNWGGIHFVNVNLYPANEWDSTCGWCHYFKDDFRFPLHSLDFLKHDLAAEVAGSDMPVIIIQHYGWDGFSELWWTGAEKDKYYQAIRNYNIIAIFQGHSHSVEKFEWKGFDIWSVGSGQRDPDPGNFLVVEINKQKMILAERTAYGWGQTFRKEISR